MTQTPLKLLISLPDNDINRYGRVSMSKACGGNDVIGEVLNFFLYKASGIAQHLEIETLEFVRIEHCTLDDILEKVKVSKKSLIAYIKQLEKWGYIKAYGYHHTYDVYFHKIHEGIENPPAPPPIKARGKHALLSLSPEERMVKLQSRYAELEREKVKIQSAIVTLQGEIVNLQRENVTLQAPVVNLQSSESCEAASEQEVMGDFGEDRILEYKESKEGEEEGEPTSLSCSLSLSVETESQEQVTTGTGSENTGAEIPSTDKTDEQPESKNPFHVPVSEKKTPPTWIKPLSSVRTTQYKMPDRLFVQPKEEQEQVPEPRPLTKNEQRKVDEAEAEDYWSVAEEVLQTTYPYGVRNSPANSHGILGIIGERRYSRADIKLGFERLDNFQIKTFTWEKFHLWLPGLLSGKYEQQQKNGGQPAKQVVYSSRPIEPVPLPTGGGWGRRLDSGAGMMPGGIGRVRHD